MYKASADELLPWQTFTRNHGLVLAFKLPFLSASVETLHELQQLADTYQMVVQSGPYHSGGWTILALVAPDGDVTKQAVMRNDRYLATQILKAGGPLHEFLYALPGALRRVRLSRLSPGEVIDWHFDDFEAKTGEDVFRIHIPIVTGPNNFQILGHETYLWQFGEAWLALLHRFGSTGRRGIRRCRWACPPRARRKRSRPR